MATTGGPTDVTACVLVVLWLAALGSIQRAGATEEPPNFGIEGRPRTIPALRKWAPQPGEFVLANPGRIVIASGDLAGTAALFADEISALTGVEYAVVPGDPSSEPGDVRLALGLDPELGEEGYELEIGESIAITAPTPTGVFYGTRTVLQLLHQDLVIPAGVARDWPRYPERGLMVDIGRRHFSLEWLEAHLRELAFLKMNILHLHFSDNEGWRIESDNHAEIVSDPHLSKDQVRELIELAERHHITIVPEIDMPGHMTAALEPFPEFQLQNRFGIRDPDKLDVTNEAARAYARDLVEEYLDLFPGPYWHMGADEYLGVFTSEASYELYPQLESYAQARHGPDANHKDAVIDFLNEINALVRSRGRTLRAWNDGLGGGGVLTADTDIVVEVWTDLGGLTAEPLLERGHRIMNAGWWPTYYPQSVFAVPRPSMATAYEQWKVHRFYGPFVANVTLEPPQGLDPGLPTIGVPPEAPVFGRPPDEVDPDEPRNLGSKIHVWSDNPQLEDEDGVAAGIFPRLRMLAQKTWESPLLTESYEEFKPIMEQVGHAPGYDP